MYGSNSKYLTRLSKKAVKRLKSEDLLDLLAATIEKPYDIHYSGALTNDEVRDIVSQKLNFKTKETDEIFPLVREKEKYKENTILFLDEPKAMQSKIYFYIEGNKNGMEERAVASVFSQYFGSGMSSLVFQEIREFRSLAYSSYGIYANGRTFEDPGFFCGFVGTQNDKTVEAISVMDSLLRKMPQKENRMPAIKSLVMQSINSGMPDFRGLSEYVEKWTVQGYDSDPREIRYKVFKDMEFKDIVDFYESNISGKHFVITIVGDKKQINIDELSKFGKIIEVKTDQIMN
jgi:predicted Zn-dependent peptidase